MSEALMPWHSRNCTKIRCSVAHLPDLAEPIRQTCTQGRFRNLGCKKNELSNFFGYNPNMQDVGLLGKNSLCMPSTCLCSRVVGAHFLLGICPCGLCCDGWAGQDECSSQGRCGLLCEVLLLQQKQQQCSEAAVLVWDTRPNRAAKAWILMLSRLCQSDPCTCSCGRTCRPLHLQQRPAMVFSDSISAWGQP